MSILIKNKKISGFSLIELMIVIAIFTIITTVALFDQGRLNSNVLLTNLAYDVALAVREAQSYGVGVKSSEAGRVSENGYGVYLDMTNKDMIKVFYDNNDNGSFDLGSDTEVKTYQFLNQRGNQVAELCVVDSGDKLSSGESSCLHLPAGKAVSSLNISFKRPDPEANFNVGGTPISGPAYIVLKSLDLTNCRAVVVEASGQIRVEGSDSKACSSTTP